MGIAGIRPGTGLHQDRGGERVTMPRRVHQRGDPLARLRICVCPRRQQDTHGFATGAGGGEHQWRRPVIRAGVGSCPGEQRPSDKTVDAALCCLFITVVAAMLVYGVTSSIKALRRDSASALETIYAEAAE